MKFEILSVVNWYDDAWDIVYRYKNVLRHTVCYDRYKPRHSDILMHLMEIHEHE